MNAEQLKPCPNCGNEKLVRLRAWLTCPDCATRYHAITGELSGPSSAPSDPLLRASIRWRQSGLPLGRSTARSS